jgi:hypothetical protein
MFRFLHSISTIADVVVVSRAGLRMKQLGLAPRKTKTEGRNEVESLHGRPTAVRIEDAHEARGAAAFGCHERY